MTKRTLVQLGLLVALLSTPRSGSALGTDFLDPQDDSGTSSIIGNYLKATQGHSDELRGASMQVEIQANVPKLQENGTLRALRKISKVGQITYRVLSFQGSSTVKSQVIARYLEAEQQGQGDNHLAITPENYKFKFKGQRPSPLGFSSYVFNLTPRKKRVGLFKGELWLDAKSYLPVFEKGRLVKNPSIFLRRVDFERAFAIQDGHSVPSTATVISDTRIIGKVQLNISYTKFAQENASSEETGTGTAESAGLHLELCQ